MAHPKLSHRRASSLSLALFLLGLAILSLTDTWYPGIFIVVGTPLALRQYFRGNIYESILTLTIFGGLFILFTFENLPWKILLPILFTLAAINILCREFMSARRHDEAEEEESLNIEIEEETTNK